MSMTRRASRKNRRHKSSWPGKQRFKTVCVFSIHVSYWSYRCLFGQMNEIIHFSDHKCSFCQRILKNTKKNDHEMRHFAQETCMGCNKTLIRIDDDLYTVHNSKTCIKVKSEAFKQEEFDVVEETIDFISRKIKSEPQPNTTGEYDDTHQINATTKTVQTEHELFESEGDILCQTSICVRELQIKTEPIEQNQDTISSDDQSSGPISPQSGYNEMGVQDSLPRNEKLIEKNYLDVESLRLLQSRGHRIRHIKASFYECYLCKFRYKHKISLILHMSYHRDGFECYMCKLEFPIESTLKIHMQRYHDLDRVEIKCELCWRTFDRNSSVQDHLCTRKAIKINKGDAVPCTCCGKIVVCKGSLQRQQTAIHNLSGKILCLICTRKHSIRTHHSRPRNPRR